MSSGKIVGHEAIEDGQNVIVIQRSERPLGGLLGFIFGTLMSLIFSQEITEINMAIIILATTLIGCAFSKGPSTRAIQKHRVISITRKRNYAAVYYDIHDNHLVGLSN